MTIYSPDVFLFLFGTSLLWSTQSKALIVWIQAGVLMESWAWCQGREQAGGLTERHSNVWKKRGPHGGGRQSGTVYTGCPGERDPRGGGRGPLLTADRGQKMEQGSGLMEAVSGGEDWEGRRAGLREGCREGKCRQDRTSRVLPGHFVISVSTWMERQLKEGLVWGLGWGGFSSLGVSSSTFVRC